MIFSIVMLAVPQLFGVYVFENHELVRTIPVFNLDRWKIILPFFLTAGLLGFIDEMIRLVTGVYCRLVMVSNILKGVLQVAVSAVMFKVLPVWNRNFVEEVHQAYGEKVLTEGNLFMQNGLEPLGNLMLTVIVLATMLEMGTTIYKTLRYGTDEKR